MCELLFVKGKRILYWSPCVAIHAAIFIQSGLKPGSQGKDCCGVDGGHGIIASRKPLVFAIRAWRALLPTCFQGGAFANGNIANF